MKTTSICLFILMVTTTLSYSQKNTLTSKWHTVDSVTQQLPRQAFAYDSKTKALYAISNDSSFLYVDLIITDEESIRKILGPGFTVWMDVSGKNKKKIGIKYPLEKGTDMDQMQSNSNQNRREARSESKRPDLSTNTQMELLGFGGIDSRVIDASKEDHVSGRLDFNTKGELTYQLKVSYQLLGIQPLSLNVMSINLESGTMSNTSGPPSRGDSAGGSGGGRGNGPPPGGGSGDRGSGGPPSGGQNGQGQTSSSPIKIKIKKIQLTDQ